jgi:hypothetical protein
MIIACIYPKYAFSRSSGISNKTDFHMNKMVEHAQLRTTNAHVIDNCRILIIKFYTWKTLCHRLLLIKQNHSSLGVLTCWSDNSYWNVALLTCPHNTLASTTTTRLYASIKIGFFHCCYSALMQIQSISFSLSLSLATVQ